MDLEKFWFGHFEHIEELCHHDMSVFYCSGGLELLCNSVKIHNVNVQPEAGQEKVSIQ